MVNAHVYRHGCTHDRKTSTNWRNWKKLHQRRKASVRSLILPILSLSDDMTNSLSLHVSQRYLTKPRGWWSCGFGQNRNIQLFLGLPKQSHQQCLYCFTALSELLFFYFSLSFRERESWVNWRVSLLRVSLRRLVWRIRCQWPLWGERRARRENSFSNPLRRRTS